MKPLRILVAEDSQPVGLFICELLRGNGHEVNFVQSGEAAVEAFRAESPELVLIDLQMPGMGGIEAIRQIRALSRGAWVPIIIVTASADEGDILEGFMVGADDYLVKPVNPLILDVRVRTMMRIAAIQRSANTVIDNVLEGIVRIDRAGRISLFNRAAEQIFGYTANEVFGRNVSMLMPSPDREAHDEYIGNYMATGEKKIIGIGRRVTGLRKNGQCFPMHLGVAEASTPEEGFFVGVIRDLTVEDALRAQVEFQAMHDLLTHLPNRAQCTAHLNERFDVPGPSGRAECSLLYCDLDGFKSVNDQFGHAVGDEVLCAAAERLKSALFVRDFIARIGGDEFIIVIDGSWASDQARRVAERIIEAFVKPIRSSAGEHRLGVSIGVAHSRAHDNLKSFAAAADAAMYRAKRQGGSQVVFAEPGV